MQAGAHPLKSGARLYPMTVGVYAPHRNGAIGTRLLRHALNEGSATRSSRMPTSTCTRRTPRRSHSTSASASSGWGGAKLLQAAGPARRGGAQAELEGVEGAPNERNEPRLAPSRRVASSPAPTRPRRLDLTDPYPPLHLVAPAARPRRRSGTERRERFGARGRTARTAGRALGTRRVGVV